MSPVDFWNIRPWETYWIVDAMTRDTPARRKEEEHARLYDLLQKAKADQGGGLVQAVDVKTGDAA